MRTIFIAIFAIMTCCAKPPLTPEKGKNEIKKSPVFNTDAPNKEVEVIVAEWKSLSKRYNLEFSNNVTIGFSPIDRSSVIGTCTYGYNWREIDLDSEYWQEATWPSKIALVYHELTHCYCFRDHDYGDGKKYQDGLLARIFEGIPVLRSSDEADGFMPDGCAVSIMHPFIQSDACFERHYGEYVKEMFNRCDPY